MQARDIMTANPATVTPDTTVTSAAQLMKDQNVGLLPVVEREGSDRLVGVVTDRDITLHHVAAGHAKADCPVREAMTDRVKTCPPDADLKQVMSVMGQEQIRRIPIVDERGALVGIVAQADIALQAENQQAAEKTLEKISMPGGEHAD